MLPLFLILPNMIIIVLWTIILILQFITVDKKNKKILELVMLHTLFNCKYNIAKKDTIYYINIVNYKYVI